MKNNSTIQHVNALLARSTLLPEDVAAAIVSGNVPPLEEIVVSLCISTLDAEVTVRNDPKSSWNEKRIARACLTIAFLGAIACTRERDEAFKPVLEQ
jgi:hypothetical protein